MVKHRKQMWNILIVLLSYLANKLIRMQSLTRFHAASKRKSLEYSLLGPLSIALKIKVQAHCVNSLKSQLSKSADKRWTDIWRANTASPGNGRVWSVAYFLHTQSHICTFLSTDSPQTRLGLWVTFLNGLIEWFRITERVSYSTVSGYEYLIGFNNFGLVVF